MVQRKRLHLWCILPILLFVLASLRNPTPIQAQIGTTVSWQPPINLSNTETASTRPTIVADPWGQVHVFWSEEVGGPAPGIDQSVGESGNTMFYRRWDGSAWSENIDIFFHPNGLTFKNPAVAIDSNGTLHLFWVGSEGVYYSNSSALAPTSAHSWRPMRVIVEAGVVDQVEIAIGHANQMYVLYNKLTATEGYTFFMKSEDEGNTWSAPQPIAFLYADEAQYAYRPRIVVDDAARLHVTWIDFTGPPTFQGLAYYYIRSEDEGLTWSAPFNLSQNLKRPEEQVSEGLLISIDQDNLLAIYIQGEFTYRQYRFSTDGGRSWSPQKHIFGELRSRAGWDAAAVDSAGTVHLIAQLRVPYAIYASTWAVDQWLDPPEAVLTEEPLNEAHYPQMVIGEGNQLHVVMQDNVVGEVWYMRGTSQAFSYAPALPAPTLVAAAPISSTLTPFVVTDTLANTEQRTWSFDSNLFSSFSETSTVSPVGPLVTSVTAVTIFIGLVVIIHVLHKSRK